MNFLQLQIILIACFVSVAAVLPGVFLVLRGIALMSDAISHSILPGIVIMFFLVQRLESPLLILGASISGLLTVILTQIIINTGKLKKDAAIGLIFPLFFSTGVILISQFARNVHLDTDIVLLGELAFTPFNRCILFGFDCGPYALWVMGLIVLLNIFFTLLFFKELNLVTFDPELSCILGFSPSLLYYALMVITSITTVGAFDTVGSIVVVALMITPPATAYLLSKKLSSMILLSVLVGIISALLGYLLAYQADVSIAGAIATTNGLFFLIALLAAPQKGIVASMLFRRSQNKTIAVDILCTVLSRTSQHKSFLGQQLGWDKKFADQILTQARSKKLIIIQNGNIVLTKQGQRYAKRLQENYFSPLPFVVSKWNEMQRVEPYQFYSSFLLKK